jgi:hypothetical protein
MLIDIELRAFLWQPYFIILCAMRVVQGLSGNMGTRKKSILWAFGGNTA